MDLISRQTAIDCINESAEMIRRALDNLDLVGTEREKFEWALDLVEAIVSDVEGLPSVQPEPKTGRWEMKPDPYGFFDEIPVCSECGCTTKWREKYLYCPNCGAKMEGWKQ